MEFDEETLARFQERGLLPNRAGQEELRRIDDKNRALQKVADYCWERARDCLVARDRTRGDGVNPIVWQAKADAFTEIAQAAQREKE